MAGAGRMDYRKYTTYTVIGGILWGTGVTVLGYFLGQVPFVRDNIEIMLVVIVGISVLPMAFELLRGWLSTRTR
jgi:membrane-associated protein